MSSNYPIILNKKGCEVFSNKSWFFIKNTTNTKQLLPALYYNRPVNIEVSANNIEYILNELSSDVDLKYFYRRLKPPINYLNGTIYILSQTLNTKIYENSQEYELKDYKFKPLNNKYDLMFNYYIDDVLFYQKQYQFELDNYLLFELKNSTTTKQYCLLDKDLDISTEDQYDTFIHYNDYDTRTILLSDRVETIINYDIFWGNCITENSNLKTVIEHNFTFLNRNKYVESKKLELIVNYTPNLEFDSVSVFTDQKIKYVLKETEDITIPSFDKFNDLFINKNVPLYIIDNDNVPTFKYNNDSSSYSLLPLFSFKTKELYEKACELYPALKLIFTYDSYDPYTVHFNKDNYEDLMSVYNSQTITNMYADNIKTEDNLYLSYSTQNAYINNCYFNNFKTLIKNTLSLTNTIIKSQKVMNFNTAIIDNSFIVTSTKKPFTIKLVNGLNEKYLKFLRLYYNNAKLLDKNDNELDVPFDYNFSMYDASSLFTDSIFKSNYNNFDFNSHLYNNKSLSTAIEDGTVKIITSDNVSYMLCSPREDLYISDYGFLSTFKIKPERIKTTTEVTCSDTELKALASTPVLYELDGKLKTTVTDTDIVNAKTIVYYKFKVENNYYEVDKFVVSIDNNKTFTLKSFVVQNDFDEYEGVIYVNCTIKLSTQTQDLLLYSYTKNDYSDKVLKNTFKADNDSTPTVTKKFSYDIEYDGESTPPTYKYLLQSLDEQFSFNTTAVKTIVDGSRTSKSTYTLNSSDNPTYVNSIQLPINLSETFKYDSYWSVIVTSDKLNNKYNQFLVDTSFTSEIIFNKLNTILGNCLSYTTVNNMLVITSTENITISCRHSSVTSTNLFISDDAIYTQDNLQEMILKGN